MLEKVRKRDINLKVAAGAASGEVNVYDLPDTGLSTSDREIAERHEREKGYSKRVFKAPMVTLAEVCQTHCCSDIHFLKIDVEGAEQQVIQGMDFDKFRPWILIVEATKPNLPTEDYASWEPLLIKSGYRAVYFDGLNRFYVSEEKDQELSSFFRAPPNVFDDFVKVDLLNARAEMNLKVGELSTSLHSSRVELSAERNFNRQLSLEKKSLENELLALRESLSWRITAPLRWLSGPFISLARSVVDSGRRFTQRMILWSMQNAFLVRTVHALLDWAPALRKYVTAKVESIVDASVFYSPGDRSGTEIERQFSGDSSLTPQAGRIYRDLNTAIRKRQAIDT
jgi:FkbM family methyltransferase